MYSLWANPEGVDRGIYTRSLSNTNNGVMNLFSATTLCVFQMQTNLIRTALLLLASRGPWVRDCRISGSARDSENCKHVLTFPKNRLKFSKSSFPIRFNLLHPQPSLFFFALESPLWCFSSLANMANH